MTTVINGSSPSITFSDSTTQTTAFTTTPTINTITSAASTALTIQSAGTTAITVDTSQNVGIGVVPSAWGSVYSKAIQISTQGAYIAGNTSTYSGGTYAWFGNNGYLDSSAVFRYTASTSACQYSQIANQHIWSYAASGTAGNAITFSEAMRIDSSGNLGLGVTPSAWDNAFKNLQVGGSGYSGSFYSQANGDASMGVALNGYYSSGWKYTASSRAATKYEQNAGVHSWSVAPSGTAGNAVSSTQAMTLDASSNLLVGDTTNTGNLTRLYVKADGTHGAATFAVPSTGSYTQIFFTNPNGNVGSISTSGSTTSYITSSDYRLKENIAPMTGALSIVAQLKPVTYNWKIDGSSGQGFIAHELQAVVPDCVTGEKDAVDSEGKPVYQGIDTSFLVATLTSAIQELAAQVTSLQAKVDAQATTIATLQNKIGA